MSILLSLYYRWRAALSAGKTAEIRGILKKSNARLVHYTIAATELSFCTVLSSFVSVFP